MQAITKDSLRAMVSTNMQRPIRRQGGMPSSAGPTSLAWQAGGIERRMWGH
jgi:hypothetical protein